MLSVACRKCSSIPSPAFLDSGFETLSLVCSVVIFYCGQFLSQDDETTSKELKEFVSVLILLANFLFVSVFLALLFQALRRKRAKKKRLRTETRAGKTDKVDQAGVELATVAARHSDEDGGSEEPAEEDSSEVEAEEKQEEKDQEKEAETEVEDTARPEEGDAEGKQAESEEEASEREQDLSNPERNV